MARTALVVIDVQRGLVDGFEDDWTTVLPTITDLVNRAHESNVPVVIVQHCGKSTGHPLHRDNPGWALHPDLPARVGDIRIEKTWSDAFRDTELNDVLQALSARSLVITGAQTEFCIDTTARRALSLGYDVHLVVDGHTTSDNGLLTREQIISHHNQTLENLATVTSTLTVGPAAQIDFLPSGSLASGVD